MRRSRIRARGRGLAGEPVWVGLGLIRSGCDGSLRGYSPRRRDIECPEGILSASRVPVQESWIPACARNADRRSASRVLLAPGGENALVLRDAQVTALVRMRAFGLSCATAIVSLTVSVFSRGGTTSVTSRWHSARRWRRIIWRVETTLDAIIASIQRSSGEEVTAHRTCVGAVSRGRLYARSVAGRAVSYKSSREWMEIAREDFRPSCESGTAPSHKNPIYAPRLLRIVDKVSRT